MWVLTKTFYLLYLLYRLRYYHLFWSCNARFVSSYWLNALIKFFKLTLILFQVHVWAGISYRGRTDLCIFTGVMDSIIYQKILAANLLPFVNTVFPDGYRLYQVCIKLSHLRMYLIYYTCWNHCMHLHTYFQSNEIYKKQ